MLTTHPDIAQATVVAREDQPGDTRLVGYVVTANGNGCRSDSLREDLRRCLSNDLMPAPLIMLDAVAVKPDGKLDHDTLSSLKPNSTQRGRARRTPQKQLLCELLAKLLGLPPINIDDNFFELGAKCLIRPQPERPTPRTDPATSAARFYPAHAML